MYVIKFKYYDHVMIGTQKSRRVMLFATVKFYSACCILSSCVQIWMLV